MEESVINQLGEDLRLDERREAIIPRLTIAVDPRPVAHDPADVPRFQDPANLLGLAVAVVWPS